METRELRLQKILQDCGGFDNIMVECNKALRQKYLAENEATQRLLCAAINLPQEIKEAFEKGVDIKDYEYIRLCFVYFNFMNGLQIMKDANFYAGEITTENSFAFIRAVREENQKRLAVS